MNATERLFRLDGKAALVTGGAGGIGAAVCTGLAEMGARVAVAGRDGNKTAACADRLRAAGHDAWSTSFDVVSVSETEKMVADTAAHFGQIDILVNCIGNLTREEKAVETTEAQFDYMMATALKGAMFQSAAVARHIIRQGTGGKHVHIGSVRGLLALRGRGFSAYCAAKGRLKILAKQLAAEWLRLCRRRQPRRAERADRVRRFARLGRDHRPGAAAWLPALRVPVRARLHRSGRRPPASRRADRPPRLLPVRDRPPRPPADRDVDAGLPAVFFLASLAERVASWPPAMATGGARRRPPTATRPTAGRRLGARPARPQPAPPADARAPRRR